MESESKPMLNLQSVGEIIEMEKAKEDEIFAATTIKTPDDLASKIRKSFTAAKNARTATLSNGLPSLDVRLRESQRQCLCIYDSNTLTAIRVDGGSEAYEPLTTQKVVTFEAWARDIVAPTDGKPWSIEPTPLPEMGDDIEQKILAKAGEFYETNIPEDVKQEDSALAGQFVYNKMKAYGSELRNQVDAERTKEARDRAKLLERRIDDQLTEAGFNAALSDFIEFLSRTPLGIVKGPVYKNVKKVSMRLNPATGKREGFVEHKKVMHFYAPRTEDVYLSPGAVDFNSGDIHEIVRSQASKIQDMIGVPGYDDDKIKEALEAFGQTGYFEDTYNDSESREHAGQPNQGQDSVNGEIDLLEFWGMKQGSDLKDTKIPKLDKDLFYQVHCVMIGNYVILAELNSNPLDRKPYHGAPFEKQAGYIYGRGIPEKVRAAQKSANLTRRALDNNIATCSGPQIIVRTGELCTDEKISHFRAYRMWQIKSQQNGNTGKAIDFYQPQMNTIELIRSLEKFYLDADKDSGIPSYAGGNPEGAVRGAAGTSSGLAMLMSAATKGVKSVMANVDTVVGSVVQMLFDMNMLDPEVPEEEKGDFNIVTKGALNMAIKEQLQATRMNFLQMVLSSPNLESRIGAEGVMALVREVTSTLDMDPNFLPTEMEMQGAQNKEYQEMFKTTVDLMFREGIIDEEVAKVLLEPESFINEMNSSEGNASAQVERPRQPPQMEA